MKSEASKKQKTFLLTGAAGFIGSNVLEFLFKKYPKDRFIVLDAITYAGNIKNISDQIKKSPRFSFWYGDIQNSKLVDDLVKQSDVIIHFAAETHVARSLHDNSKFFQTDVLGTQAIANAVLNHKDKIDRFIHISTCEVYGTAEYSPMDERHPLNPRSPYAAAKAGADRLVSSYYHSYDIPMVIVRPFNIYGPHQHLEKAIPRFITSGILGEPITVHGEGKYTRDFLHVSDLAIALEKILKAPRKKVIGHIFNVGSGRGISIVDIAQKVAKEMKLPKEQLKFIGDRPGQVMHFACNYRKMKRMFGWGPKKDFDKGLSETIKWYKNNKEVWKDQIWMRHVPILTSDGKIEMH